MKTKNKSILISVNVRTYNSDKTITKTLDSVKNQTYKNIEIIISDGYSKDRTLEIARKYEARIFFAEQLGNARSQGIIKSKGKYVVSLDSDQIMDRNLIEKCVSLCESKKYDALIISERSLITKGNYIERLIAYDKWVIDKGRNIKEIFNTACPRFFDKKILKNIKWPKNLSIFDDTILYDRILQNGGRVGYMGSASIRHHEVTSWQVLVKKFFRYGKGYLKAFREYPPGIAAHSLPRVSYFRKDAFKQPKYFFGLFLLYLVKALAASAGVFSNLLDEKVLEKR